MIKVQYAEEIIQPQIILPIPTIVPALLMLVIVLLVGGQVVMVS